MPVPFRTVLEWHDFAVKKPKPGEGVVLISDGIIHRVGWWSVTEQAFYIPNADGTNGVIDLEIVCWAHLPNMVADFEEFFGPIRQRIVG